MAEIPVLTISELTRRVKDLIEGRFPSVCVVGEISNCTKARSGHVYLTLKDDEAQIRAILWRSRAARLKYELHDGLEVIAAGGLEVYQPRGTYQLIVEELVPQGIGALELAFRQLQEKLAAEGLFDVERKRPLPRFPRRIALVTSPTGAAVRDMLQVITRRWPAADLVIVPVKVQGEGAAEEIAAALRTVHRIPEVDVVVTGRGGGSLEDLWAFNEESVARAVFHCARPVISAVGHEVDVSIADLVADRRALTPSEAAELIVPDRGEILHELGRLQDRLTAGLRDRAGRARLQLDALASRQVLRRPLDRVRDLNSRLVELDARLKRTMQRRLEQARHNVASLANSLEALSPLKVLQRGYSITRRADNGRVVRNTEEVATGDDILTILEHGRVRSRVESVDPEPDPQLRAVVEENAPIQEDE